MSLDTEDLAAIRRELLLSAFVLGALLGVAAGSTVVLLILRATV